MEASELECCLTVENLNSNGKWPFSFYVFKYRNQE